VGERGQNLPESRGGRCTSARKMVRKGCELFGAFALVFTERQICKADKQPRSREVRVSKMPPNSKMCGRFRGFICTLYWLPCYLAHLSHTWIYVHRRLTVLAAFLCYKTEFPLSESFLVCYQTGQQIRILLYLSGIPFNCIYCIYRILFMFRSSSSASAKG